MGVFVQPITNWGSTIGQQLGTTGQLSTSTIEYNGIDFYDTLNKKKFSAVMEFSGFYGIIKDTVLSRLGYPIVKVELTDHALYGAIDEAISKLDYHAPLWCVQLATFRTMAGVNLYKLPPFMINNFQYAAYKKTLFSIAQQNGTLEFDFFIKYFQENFLFNDMMISDMLIMQMHLEMTRKILGREGSFTILNNEFLHITPTPVGGDLEEVAIVFRALDLNKLHHYYVSWIQRYALAISKEIVGTIRKKYKTLPGPDGGAQLDGKELVEEGKQEKAQLMEELTNEIEEPPMPFSLY